MPPTVHTRHALTAFISHSAKRDVSSLRRLLDDAGVRVRDSFGVPSASLIREGVASDIQEADFVLAVLDTEAARIFFEIGFATALHKPILLIAEPGTSLPFDLAQHRLVTAHVAEFRNPEALRFAGSSKSLRASDRISRHVLGQGRNRASAILQPSERRLRQLAAEISTPSETTLGRVTTELLKAAGVTAVEEFWPARVRRGSGRVERRAIADVREPHSD